MMKLRNILAVAIVAVALPTAAHAQDAQLSGRILDPSDAVVSKATVTVISKERGVKRVTTSNDQGVYVLPALQPGTYVVTVAADGFQPTGRDNVVLEVAQRAQLDFKLQVGNVEQQVSVRADTPILGTRDGSVGITIDRHFAENVPMSGRTFHSLIELSPGVTTYNGRFTANGQRTDANYFTVDGVSANVTSPSRVSMEESAAGQHASTTTTGGYNGLTTLDALQEVRIQTSTFAPEFGRTPGAQVSVATRSGTNDYHGSLFESYRDDAFRANDWFTNNRHLPALPLKQHGFGAALGGPIVRNGIFFFGAYEGLWLRDSRAMVTAVPSMESRRLAVSAIRPLFEAFPLPTGPDRGDGMADFATTVPNDATSHVASGRLDARLGARSQVFARYSDTPSQASTTYVGDLQDIYRRLATVTLGLNYTFAPAIVAEVRGNYTRNTYYERIEDLANLGGWFPPFLEFGERDNLLFADLGGSQVEFGTGASKDNLQRQVNVVGSLVVTRARHQLKFGADFRRLSPELDSKRQHFIGLNNVQDAIAGIVTSMTVFEYHDPGTVIYQNLSIFGQDTWRPIDPLTVTYGVRWDVNPPPSFEEGREAFAALNVGNPATIGFAERGTPVWQTRLGNVAPRLGIAYDLDRTGRTVLSGGTGMFFDTGTQNSSFFLSGSYYPVLTRKNLTRVQFPLTPEDLRPAAQALNPPITSQVVVADPNLKSPMTVQWNLRLERQLGSDQSVSVAYVAARGHDLLTKGLFVRPNPSFTGNVFVLGNEGRSRYDALQAHYRRRMSSGLQISASYTHGRSFDNVSDSMLNYLPVQKQQGSEWGPSDYDVRHNLTAAVSWKLPSVTSRCAVCDSLINNWSIDLLSRARSGAPINVTTGLDPLATGLRTQRPDVVSGVPFYLDDESAPGGRRLNRDAFAVPVGGRQGNLGRNALRGFAASQVDAALHRSIKLPSGVNLSLRIEAFNVLNTANFTNPTSVLSSSLFGTSRSVLNALSLQSIGERLGTNYLWGGARTVELGVRVAF